MYSLGTVPVQQHLWQHALGAERLYAILDGARDDRIYPNILLSGTRYECLYRGQIPEALAAAAPYLIEMRPDLEFTRWFFRYGWGHSWGIFLTAPADMDELKQHFRRFLTVRDEDGRRLYFRYYDPRVLRVYLPTCNQKELDFVFGPVSRYLLESERREEILHHRREGVRLLTEAVPLT